MHAPDADEAAPPETDQDEYPCGLWLRRGEMHNAGVTAKGKIGRRRQVSRQGKERGEVCGREVLAAGQGDGRSGFIGPRQGVETPTEVLKATGW